MQLLLKNNPNAGYETSDVVAVVPDDHVWGSGELDTSVFTIVTNVTLTDAEKDLLLVADEQIEFPVSALKLPGLRKGLETRDNMQYKGRRRYKYTTQIERK